MGCNSIHQRVLCDNTNPTRVTRVHVHVGRGIIFICIIFNMINDRTYINIFANRL